jgi:hypothetical protein
MASLISTRWLAVTGAQHSSPARPDYKSLRYDEDYSFLSDPAQRSDWLDFLKYVPLGAIEGRYLSIGGEVRQRYEFFHNPDFGESPADSNGNNDWLLQRYLLHGDLHVNPSLRFFGQFMSGFQDGRIGGPQPDTDADTFDAHQAFVDWTRFPGDERTATWRLGRQEFDYGSGRLISAREAPNLRRSFDAVRLLIHANEWQVDGFWSRPVRNQLGVFDDDPNPLKQLWGVYSVAPLAAIPGGHADLYYLGLENKEGTFFQGTAYELRHTLGTRIWGKPMPWEYNVELIWQFGTFGTGNIQAWAVASDTHYNFSEAPLRPRLGLTADITSGDRDPSSPNLQTYNPLFPIGAYFNLADLGGPSNFIHLHPRLDLHFGDRVKGSFDWGFFWRESLNDAFFQSASPPSNLARPVAQDTSAVRQR